MNIRRAALALGLLCASIPFSAVAQEKVVASVNGKPVTEVDLALAANEFGPGLEQLTGAVRLRALLEVVVENQLLADAAEKAGLNSAKGFQLRLNFARRKLLRDEYFASRIAPQVTEAEAKKVYDEQLAGRPSQDEVHVLHILAETEAEARELRAKLAAGTDFRKLAQQFSKDAGSNWNGGDLGYFGKGQMDEEFEAAAFSLPKDNLSDPLKTRFGWHLILIEDRRVRALPEFEAVKADLVGLLAQRKAQEVIAELVGKAKIEILDPELKKTVPDAAPAPAAKAAPLAKARAAPAAKAPASGDWAGNVFGQ